MLAYAIMLGAAGVVYWYLRGRGLLLIAPTAAPGQPLFGPAGGAAHVDALMHVLLALVVVIVVARAIGSLFAYFAQPPVVGEILAGILLGPSVLGRFAPTAQHYLLPAEVAPFLGVLSQVGVILYMFLVGVELDPTLLRKRGHATLAISHASIVTPFLLGAALALFLYPTLGTRDVPFTVFSLFIGVSMSVTAFPVLARILTDRKMHKSPMGVIALTCAAIDDVTAWCLLAFVVSVAQARTSGAFITFASAVGYIAVIAFVARPAMVRLSRLYGLKGRLTQGVMAIVFVALLLSALATDMIGIHAVFGAFALGAIIPHDSGLARELTDRLEDLVVVLLLPAFFAFTGMHTQIGLVTTGDQWILCGIIILVASAGKFGGSLVAARLTGMGWRDASALGVLMNTRGLMELIVLNIGLELRVLSPTLFAMLVLMALVTTFATTPILHFITRNTKGFNDEQRPRDEERPPAGGGILVPISNPDGLAALLDLAAAATRVEDPPPRVLALVRRPAGGIRSGLREIDRKESPRSPVLVQAIDIARATGAPIDANALWTDDAAADILDLAAQPSIGWLLLGYHRPVFGGDLLGGVVKEVLDGMSARSVNVGVVIHGHDRPIDRVIAVVDDTADGRAGLELAARIVAKKRATLHAVLVPDKDATDPSPGLEELLRETGKKNSGRWLHSDVLTQRNPAALAYQTHGDLVVIGMALADELGLPLDDVPGAERCVLLVRGAKPPAQNAAVAPAAASNEHSNAGSSS
ncbi:MAG: Sodium/hydrogen exchanger [Myxococcales bacterium]|nr:Sodium/hydrogen exchanger [Myxococcales bacterium]